MNRYELDAAVIDWISEGIDVESDDDRFNRLALALFEFQHRENISFRRISESCGKSPSNVTHWRDIPPVPTGAFKEARLTCFPPEESRTVFQTSGSTTGSRGRLELDTTRVYEASLLATFGHYLCPDAPIRMAILAPDTRAAPDSSL